MSSSSSQIAVDQSTTDAARQIDDEASADPSLAGVEKATSSDVDTDNKDDENGDDDDDDPEYVDKEYSFHSESLSDITLHFDCTLFHMAASYHVHRLTLVTMSKFFEAVLIDVDESTPSKCEKTERCKSPNHRCLEIGTGTIGGRTVIGEDLNVFFRHMYSIADGRGYWKELIKDDRGDVSEPFWHLKYVTSVDTAKDEVVVEHWEYDGNVTVTLKLTEFLEDVNQTTTTVGSWYWTSFHYEYEHAHHPHYHFANYFHCDALMKLYEKQAEVIINQIMTMNLAYPVAWDLLRLSDRYCWTDVRKLCLQACARDKKCRERASWKRFAKTLKFDTLLEVFYTSLETNVAER